MANKQNFTPHFIRRGKKIKKLKLKKNSAKFQFNL